MTDWFSLQKQLSAKWHKVDWFLQEMTGTDADAINAEMKVGRDLADVVKDTNRIDDDASVMRFLREMGDYLTSYLNQDDYQFTFRPIRSRAINAFALPGGFIFVTRGLMEFCEWNQDEIAFVIAHEIGHVVRHHAKDAITNDLLVDAASLALPAKGIFKTPLRLVLKKFVRSDYSKECEFVADEFAVRLTHRAKFQLNGPVAFFDRVCDRTDVPNTKDQFTLFSTHPPADERIAKIRQIWSKLETRTV